MHALSVSLTIEPSAISPVGRRRDQRPVNGVDLGGLLERVAAGDRDAFEQFYDATADLVFGIARRVVIDRDLAAEVAQEVFLEVWRKSAGFQRTRGSAKTWVAVMAKRRAIDAVRSTQAARDRDQNHPGGVIESGDPVGDTVAAHEDRSRVSDALGALTELQREALELAFFRGLTHREVAEELDVALGTVKTRIRDGLSRLAAAMGESDG